jgi:hypothetical protein
MKIDTQTRHVTKQGANLSLELAFSAAEAKYLFATSRQQVNNTLPMKTTANDALSPPLIGGRLCIEAMEYESA